MGIRTCADLRQGSKLSLVREFGSFGERLWGLAHGIDERPVEVDSRRQSVSVECTFDRDLPDLAACLEELPTLLSRSWTDACNAWMAVIGRTSRSLN